MAVIPVTPRPVNSAERAVLEKILATNFPGSAKLRKQIDTCEVVSQGAENSVSVDIEPTTATVPAPDAPIGPVPVTATVQALPGESLPLEGEILIWVGRGFISGIEYAWYGETMPTRLPSPERIHIEADDTP
ncbi:hypothetical protein [Streptomyces sp. NBC_01431]|uniref:hypothetical protein n=1 Tax=Streptomyces sp. NBC_01431 TaxID=2903863 RepID=UPI002E32B9C2|nr:hypothetical protein [Streptomyces sp. NBC_01431]